MRQQQFNLPGQQERRPGQTYFVLFARNSSRVLFMTDEQSPFLTLPNAPATLDITKSFDQVRREFNMPKNLIEEVVSLPPNRNIESSYGGVIMRDIRRVEGGVWRRPDTHFAPAATMQVIGHLAASISTLTTHELLEQARRPFDVAPGLNTILQYA